MGDVHLEFIKVIFELYCLRQCTIMECMKELNIATFNLQGLTAKQKQKALVRDMKDSKIDICCTQETKIKDGIDKNIKNYRLIALPTESKHYGNGFIISKKLVRNIHRYWKVSDRIVVLQLYTSENTVPRKKYVRPLENIRIQISQHTTKPKK